MIANITDITDLGIELRRVPFIIFHPLISFYVPVILSSLDAIVSDMIYSYSLTTCPLSLGFVFRGPVLALELHHQSILAVSKNPISRSLPDDFDADRELSGPSAFESSSLLPFSSSSRSQPSPRTHRHALHLHFNNDLEMSWKGGLPSGS